MLEDLKYSDNHGGSKPLIIDAALRIREGRESVVEGVCVAEIR